MIKRMLIVLIISLPACVLAGEKQPIDLTEFGVIDHFVTLRKNGHESACINVAKVATQFYAQFTEGWSFQDSTDFLKQNEEVFSKAGFAAQRAMDYLIEDEELAVSGDRKKDAITFGDYFLWNCSSHSKAKSSQNSSYTAFNGNKLPRYDVDAHCEEIKNFSGGSNQIYNTCVDTEQTSYNNLKISYPNIPSETADYCEEIAGFSGGSYQMLETCIKQETKASSGKKKFKY